MKIKDIKYKVNRERAIAYALLTRYEVDVKFTRAQVLNLSLHEAFYWSSSPEGVDYWDKIDKRGY